MKKFYLLTLFFTPFANLALAQGHHTGGSGSSYSSLAAAMESTALSKFQEGDENWEKGLPRPFSLPILGSLTPGIEAGKIEVMLPDDRCKAGVIQFGAFECRILGKAIQHTCPSPSSLIPSPLQDNNKGDTPLGVYDVTERAKDGTEKAHWGKTPMRITRKPPMKTEDGGQRGGFLIHSNTNAEARGENIGAEPGARPPEDHVTGTWGCLKVHSACLEALDKYRRENGGTLSLSVRDERGSTDPQVTKGASK